MAIVRITETGSVHKAPIFDPRNMGISWDFIEFANPTRPQHAIQDTSFVQIHRTPYKLPGMVDNIVGFFDLRPDIMLSLDDTNKDIYWWMYDDIISAGIKPTDRGVTMVVTPDMQVLYRSIPGAVIVVNWYAFKRSQNYMYLNTHYEGGSHVPPPFINRREVLTIAYYEDWTEDMLVDDLPPGREIVTDFYDSRNRGVTWDYNSDKDLTRQYYGEDIWFEGVERGRFPGASLHIPGVYDLRPDQLKPNYVWSDIDIGIKDSLWWVYNEVFTSIDHHINPISWKGFTRVITEEEFPTLWPHYPNQLIIIDYSLTTWNEGGSYVDGIVVYLDSTPDMLARDPDPLYIIPTSVIPELEYVDKILRGGIPETHYLSSASFDFTVRFPFNIVRGPDTIKMIPLMVSLHRDLGFTSNTAISKIDWGDGTGLEVFPDTTHDITHSYEIPITALGEDGYIDFSYPVKVYSKDNIEYLPFNKSQEGINGFSTETTNLLFYTK